MGTSIREFPPKGEVKTNISGRLKTAKARRIEVTDKVTFWELPLIAVCILIFKDAFKDMLERSFRRQLSRGRIP
jgi:ASC-1-like (ASCH) protein